MGISLWEIGPGTGQATDPILNNDYGYVDLIRRDFYEKRTFSADEYVMYCSTHSDHILIPEPYKTKFLEGLKNAVLAGGDKVEFRDTYVLYLTKKPA